MRLEIVLMTFFSTMFSSFLFTFKQYIYLGFLTGGWGGPCIYSGGI